jgi:hypothetical protein
VTLRLALLVALAVAAAGCSGGGGEGEETTRGTREAAPAPATPEGPLRGEPLVSALRGGGFVIYFLADGYEFVTVSEL